MTEHKYSVGDIQRMRVAIQLLIWPRGLWQGPIMGCVPDDVVRRNVEDQLRTYMQNGTDPYELERAAREAVKEAA
jgi:hypothetical protein